jgi:hypothetical protein
VVTKLTYLYVTPQVLPQALATVEAGAELQLVSVEGDWYLVEYQSQRWGRRRGYIQRSATLTGSSSPSGALPNSRTGPATKSPAPQPPLAGAGTAQPRPVPPTPQQMAPPRRTPSQLPRSRPSAIPPRASLLPPVSPRPYARPGACESGHWIDGVEGDGKVIKLEDGSALAC